MAHGDEREGKWRGNWRMEWVASTLHTTSEHGVSSITTAEAHNSATSSRLNWRPRRFKGTRPFRRKTRSGFCACAITFQKKSTTLWITNHSQAALRSTALSNLPHDLDCKSDERYYYEVLTRMSSSFGRCVTYVWIPFVYFLFVQSYY
jgi:hypothetical protein